MCSTLKGEYRINSDFLPAGRFAAPSACHHSSKPGEIRKGFENYTLKPREGRTLVGFLEIKNLSISLRIFGVRNH